MKGGRLETLVTVPVGGWDFAINDGGGADTATAAAGVYTPDEFVLELKTKADAATGRTHTITISDGGDGTGIVTWAISQASSITFPDTDARDYLGFTGNLASSTSHVAPTGMQAMFIPHAQMVGPDLDPASTGAVHLKRKQLKGPGGKVWTRGGSTGYRSFRDVTWERVNRSRAVEGVDPAFNSFERWFLNTQTGLLSYFPIDDAGEAPHVRVIWDADNDTVIGDAAGGDGIYRAVIDNLDMAMPDAGFVMWRTIRIRELVKV